MSNSEAKFIPKNIDLRKDIIALSERCIHAFVLKRIDDLNIGTSWQNGLKAFVDNDYQAHPDNMENLHSFLSNHPASDVELSSLDITAIIPLLLFYRDFQRLYVDGYSEKITTQFKSRFFDFLNIRNAIRHYAEEILISKREDLVLDQMDGICTIIRFSLLCEKYCKNGDFWKECIKQAFYYQRILRGELLFLTEKDKETDLSPNSNLCEIELRAEMDDDSAQTLLGKMLYEGNRYEPDYGKAFYWFYKAAKKNNKEAAYYVGKSYRAGFAVDFDYKKGWEWNQKAVELGYPPAMHEYAVILFADTSIQDKHELIEILNKLIEINYAPAFWTMGLCYKGGIGVEKDLQKSQELIERSALLGYAYAAEDLAKSAINNSDINEAKKWLEIGAKQKSRWSIEKLKRFEETGHFH